MATRKLSDLKQATRLLVANTVVPKWISDFALSPQAGLQSPLSPVGFLSDSQSIVVEDYGHEMSKAPPTAEVRTIIVDPLGRPLMIMLAIILGLVLSGAHAVGGVAPRNSGFEPLCTVLAEAAQHDNSLVTIKGVYILLPHGAVITAPDCTLSPRTSVNVRLADNFRQKDRVMRTLWSLTRERKPVEVIVKGTLHVAKKEQGFGQGVEPYEIEVTKFLSAEPYAEPTGVTMEKPACLLFKQFSSSNLS